MNASVFNLNLSDHAGPRLHPDIDNQLLRMSLMIIGSVTVAVNALVIVCAFTKAGNKADEKFLLLGFSTCYICGGIMTGSLSMYLEDPVSATSCRLIHIFVPAVCCATVLYLLAIFVCSYAAIRDAKPEVDNDYMLLVFVFVAWFISIVCSSLPVVSDGDNIQYGGVCDPEGVFLDAFRDVLAYYIVIFILPAIAVNCIFVISALKLRELLINVSATSSQRRDANSTSSWPTTSDMDSEQKAAVDYSQQTSWEKSVITRWKTIMQSKRVSNAFVTKDSKVHFNSLAQRKTLLERYKINRNKSCKKNTRETAGKPNSRLWKKLQDTVFSPEWRSTQAIGTQFSAQKRNTQIRDSSHDSEVASTSTAHMSITGLLNTTTQPLRKRKMTTPQQNNNNKPKPPDYSVFKQRLITQFAFLMALNASSFVRVLLVAQCMNPGAGMSIEILLLTSLNLENVVGTVISVVRFPHARNCLKQIYLFCYDRLFQ